VNADAMPLDQDRRAIARIVHAYAVAVDGDDPDRFASLFTQDGLLSTGTRLLHGRAEIASVIREIRALFFRTMHQVTTHASEPEGDGARGTTYCTAFHLSNRSGDTADCLEIAVRYHDRFARLAEGWRIAEQRLDVPFVRTYAVDLKMRPLLTVGAPNQ
jgi:ketosteroid isomerase-like protein